MKKTSAPPRSHQSAFLANEIARGATIMRATSSWLSTKSSPTSGVVCPSVRRGRSCSLSESEREYIARLKRSIFSRSCSDGSCWGGGGGILQFYPIFEPPRPNSVSSCYRKSAHWLPRYSKHFL